MRKALTDEDKEIKKVEKEKETKAKLKEFKDKKYLENISDDVLLKFILKLEKDYDDLEIEDALNLLFKNFINGKFQFTAKKIYE